MSWFSELINPPVSKIPLPQMNNYAPGNMAGADASAFGGIGNLGNFNMYPGMMGAAQDITGNLINNSGIPSWMQGADQAMQMGQFGANNAFTAGGGLMGTGFNLIGTAADPRGDLYNRTIQQLQDQTRASQGARGIANTPYGAGLENKTMSDFNIDWNNQQLMRLIAGSQAGAGLIGQGAGMQAGAPGQFYTASAMPYQTNQTIGGNQFGALSNLGNFGTAGAQIPQQQIGDWMNYLGWGTGALNAGNSANLGGFNAALARDKQGWGQMTDAMGGIGKAVGAAAPYAMAMFSDERIKDDIHQVGELYDGLPVYSFRYKGDPAVRVGLMAQDVEKRRPDAVVEIGGIKAVDYGKATEWSRGLAALSNW